MEASYRDPPTRGGQAESYNANNRTRLMPLLSGFSEFTAGLDLGRLRRLFSEGAWIIAGQIATLTGSLVLIRLLTGSMDPRAYGEMALGLTVAGLINQTVTGSVSNGISRFWSIASERGDLVGYIAASRHLLLLAIVAICITSALVVGALWAVGLSTWAGLAFASLALAVSSGVNSVLNGMQTAARQRSIVALHSGLDAWLKIGLAACFMAWIGASSSVVVWSYACSATLVTLSQFYFLNSLIRGLRCKPSTTSISPAWLKEIWSYSWPFATWGVFTWAQTCSDRWALQAFVDTDAVGLYTVLYQLGFVPISLASGLLVAFLAPIMFQHAGDAGDAARMNTVYRSTSTVAIFVLGMSFAAAIAISLLHKWLFSVLASTEFQGPAYLMPWMAIAAGFQACHHILGIRISAALKTKLIILPQMASAGIFVLLVTLGAYLGKIDGLVVGFFMASFLHFLWILMLSEYIRVRVTVTSTALP